MRADAPLFMRVNAVEVTELKTAAIKKLFGFLDITGCMDEAAGAAFVSLLDPAATGAMTGDSESSRQKLVDIGLGLSQDAALCLCETASASTGVGIVVTAACAAVKEALSAIDFADSVIEEIMGATDALDSYYAYAYIDLCTSDVTLSADRTTINRGESTRLHAALNCPSNNYLLDWEPKTGLTQETMGSTDVTVSPLTTTTYSLHISGFYLSDRASDSITITVNEAPPGNQSPIANEQSVAVTLNTAKAITLTATDPDNGPQALTYTIVSQPSPGALSGTPPNVTYTPNTGYNGNDSFAFKVNDGAADSNIATVSITVQSGGAASGSIVAWGRNVEGQCNVPAPNTGFVAVAAGGGHSLGLKTDGSIVAWGHNADGQCNVPAPNSGFVAVAAGVYHSLGLKADGSIVAWGGNGYPGNPPAPNSGFVAISAGVYHSLGLKADGSIVAWGSNHYGLCNVPAPNSGFVAVAGGESHSLGLKRN
jgi:hypothetical protein